MLSYSDLKVERMSLEKLPSYWRVGSHCPMGNSYIRCGAVKRGGNEPYCFPQEKMCANHICRVLCPEKTISTALVIRDDGTVWEILLDAFQEVVKLELTKGETA